MYAKRLQLPPWDILNAFLLHTLAIPPAGRPYENIASFSISSFVRCVSASPPATNARVSSLNVSTDRNLLTDTDKLTLILIGICFSAPDHQSTRGEWLIEGGRSPSWAMAQLGLLPPLPVFGDVV